MMNLEQMDILLYTSCIWTEKNKKCFFLSIFNIWPCFHFGAYVVSLKNVKMECEYMGNVHAESVRESEVVLTG